jgi:2-hydroxychromene-2-carboxylate isomerase
LRQIREWGALLLPMGDLISLAQHRQSRSTTIRSDASRPGPVRPAPGAERGGRAPGRDPVTFSFDLASPFTYLAAERVERQFQHVVWRPALSEALHGGAPVTDADDLAAMMARADSRAQSLRMPLVWPDRYPTSARAAMRVASLAADRGKGGRFVLAATRLAFCGGFDLEDPEVLAEAAAAACLGLDECLAAAKDTRRDGRMEEAGRRLLAQGADRLPVVRVGRTLYCGEDRVSQAVSAARTLPPARRAL